MSAEPQFPGREPEVKNRHLSLVSTSSSEKIGVEAQSPRALVPEAAPRNNRKLLIAVFSLVPLVLLLILLVNILTASRQYDLVDLRTQEETLTQQNEALSQEIEYYQAPQDLAIRASQLGLVSTSVQATIDLQTGTISGEPAAVTAGENSEKNLIDPPSLNDTEASAVASERAEEQKKQEAAASASAEASKNASAQASAESSDSGSSQPSASAGDSGN